MIEFVVFVLSVSFYFYTMLGGADFGAGIIELFAGNKTIRPIYKAIAPVWEVNHMWLILAVVITFNAFPPIYTQMSISLHIPLFVILMGIVLRGTAFTFRHYDTHEDETHVYYHWIFRLSSLLTALFLGITLGAMLYGRIDTTPTSSYYAQFIAPWFNWFCLSLGVFVALIFAYIASVFLIGEVLEHPKQVFFFAKVAKRTSLLMVVMGAVVLGLAYWYEVPFLKEGDNYLWSGLSIGLASVLMFFIWKCIDTANVFWMRILTGAQIAFIMMGWAMNQIPTILYTQQGNHLTIYNSVASDATLYYLCIALLVGVIIIFPSIYYLFRIFKFQEKPTTAD
ncbi:MAG: cytochrome d ubiquinol oxidase subunit II [Aureispira sp.]